MVHIHPDDAERVHASFQAFLQSEADIWSAEYRLRHADGSYAMVCDRASLVRSTAGTPARMVGALVDISARKQAEEALQLRVRQQAAVATLGQRALQGIELSVLLNQATVMLAQILDVEYCKV